MGLLPQVRVQAFPHLVRGVVVRPSQVQCQVRENIRTSCIRGTIAVCGTAHKCLLAVALAARRCVRAPSERVRNDCLGFFFDASQMVLAEETLGVNLVNLFGTGRARRKPAILCDHLYSANGVAVTGRRGQNLLDLFAGNFGSPDVGRGQLLKRGFFFRGGGRLNAFVNRISQVSSEFTVDFARIFSQTSGDFRGEQTRDDSVFVGGPHATIET